MLSLALSVIDLLAAMFSGYGLMYLTLSFFQVMVWISTYDWSLRRVCSHSLARPMAYCRWLGTERIIFAATSHKNGSTISAGSSFLRRLCPRPRSGRHSCRPARAPPRQLTVDTRRPCTCNPKTKRTAQSPQSRDYTTVSPLHVLTTRQHLTLHTGTEEGNTRT